jgi:peroxin-14
MNSPRADLISQARTFLSDPSVATHPISKKLQYLESKGLTPTEIDAALGSLGAISLGGGALKAKSGLREADWRDWFVMVTVGGAVSWVGYRLMQVSKNNQEHA